MMIKDLPIDWRKHLTPAYFRQAEFQFHVEVGGRASGRRVVPHEFPKRNLPYAEDMGRRAVRWTVQGYIIVGPSEEPAAGRETFMRTDYIPARDALINALEADGPGWLKLPTFDEPMFVMCDQYRVDETRERGGIAIFDMVFIERGVPPGYDAYQDTSSNVGSAATELGDATQAWIDTMLHDSNLQGSGGSMVQDSVDAYMGNFGGRGGS